MSHNPFEFRPEGFSDETPAAVTAYHVAALDNPPVIREVFYPDRGWTRHTSIPVGRTLTNRAVRALKANGVTAVEVTIAENRHANFTIFELTR